MPTLPLRTRRLTLVPNTVTDALAMVADMDVAQRAQVSARWLAALGTSDADVWTLGFTIVLSESGSNIGSCGFKGPPDGDAAVEVAYGIAPEHENFGYTTEACEALVTFALGSERVHLIRAHTLPEVSGSTRVLTKCGFERIGEIVDPEDGLVWRWERPRRAVDSAHADTTS